MEIVTKHIEGHNGRSGCPSCHPENLDVIEITIPDGITLHWYACGRIILEEDNGYTFDYKGCVNIHNEVIVK